MLVSDLKHLIVLNLWPLVIESFTDEELKFLRTADINVNHTCTPYLNLKDIGYHSYTSEIIIEVGYKTYINTRENYGLLLLLQEARLIALSVVKITNCTSHYTVVFINKTFARLVFKDTVYESIFN